MWARITRLMVMATAVAVLALGWSPNLAQAAGPYLTGSAAMRDCVNISLSGCQPVGSWSAGTPVSMTCWIDDSWATGAYSSNRWFYVVNGTKKSFVHSSWVASQTSVPHCSTHAGVMASRWGSMHRDQTRPSAYEASVLGISNGMWSGWCAAFTYGSYKLGAGRTPKYPFNAAPRYWAYKNAGLMRQWTGGDINVGSMLFWPNLAAPYGHTAIYAGNGHVISTIGNGDPTKPVLRVPVSYFGAPAGWVAYWDV